MRRVFAELANATGQMCDDRKMRQPAELFYQLASHIDPRWSAPLYNLGLMAKYAGEWEHSAEFNRQAVEVNPKNQEAWWNLGIAATALHDWEEARRAWLAYGIDMVSHDGEVRMSPSTACVRINPSGSGEVVWGERLDPARITVLSVPLPESGHRFYDILLNDGAPNGTRTFHDQQVPVFDELAIWRPSKYSTFQVNLNIPGDQAFKHLVDLCNQKVIGVEDWSTIRYTCVQCSRGNLGPHQCNKKEEEKTGRKAFGFAATSDTELYSLLHEWVYDNPKADHGQAELLLAASKL